MNHLKFAERINVTKPKLPPIEAYTAKIQKIWDNHWLSNNGPLHEEFKTALKKFLNVKHLELFVNGHSALELALKSLNLSGEVITTPFTFASTVQAILNTGLKPVFCDIETQTYNIDTSQIEKLINEKTSAIIAVHVYGNPCDVYEIERIAKQYNLKVIYDAAHAFGVTIDGKSIAEFGDISMFSMHATKVFHSIEGGLLTFKDAALETKLKMMKNFGISAEDSVDMPGVNAKMNEFQAAMGIVNLETFDLDIMKRKQVYFNYKKYFAGFSDIKMLAELEGVSHNYSYFPVLFEQKEIRDYVFHEAKKYNLYTRKYFYPLCNEFTYCQLDKGNTLNASDVSNRMLALPMYADLDENTIEQICKIIKTLTKNISLTSSGKK
ncbi:DegT/DnrJ/EryC1/StrS family aminotransferase [Bacillus sp. CLL-7-23]|uniref:DegT/DnrJ/EryC1/StrS family aminotransferase n=1 Tax=Bacillus changyiensis TaxID=3004103 RepID=A0ABT4X1B3_9BACI|nr:DegT/DnrJ/EryC1/StrS family aminotransferase [Bacillus changyiensis]MDA7025484.1 DegT/DnrJ/EryC1/StrS family aminotransferase [Bacillus changyiensis]